MLREKSGNRDTVSFRASWGQWGEVFPREPRDVQTHKQEAIYIISSWLPLYMDLTHILKFRRENSDNVSSLAGRPSRRVANGQRGDFWFTSLIVATDLG